MHTDITYKGNVEEKDIAAIKDAKNWLTEEQFNIICDTAKAGATYSKLEFYLGMAGVQGYPVTAIYKKYSPNEDANEAV